MRVCLVLLFTTMQSSLRVVPFVLSAPQKSTKNAFLLTGCGWIDSGDGCVYGVATACDAVAHLPVSCLSSCKHPSWASYAKMEHPKACREKRQHYADIADRATCLPSGGSEQCCSGTSVLHTSY